MHSNVERHEQPVERCHNCGQATAWAVWETRRWSGGDETSVWRRAVEHPRRACEAFQALEKETWPVLPFD